MKKFIAAFVVLVTVIASTYANDYAVIKNGEKVIIHQISYNSNMTHVWVETFELVNPTVKQLSDIGLPNYCWSQVNGQDGAYDTRLDKSKQELDEMKANYENAQENVNYLEDQMEWNKVYTMLWIISAIAFIITIAVQRGKIIKLKQNQK
jgi:hypothetical protein